MATILVDAPEVNFLPGVTVYFDEETYAILRDFMDKTNKTRSDAIATLMRHGYIAVVKMREKKLDAFESEKA